MSPPATTFPVTTFKRVFDTTPAQEVLSLAELTECFRRFELKPQLHAKIEGSMNGQKVSEEWSWVRLTPR